MRFVTTVHQKYSLEGKGLVHISRLFACVHFNDDILIKNTEKDYIVKKNWLVEQL